MRKRGVVIAICAGLALLLGKGVLLYLILTVVMPKAPAPVLA